VFFKLFRVDLSTPREEEGTKIISITDIEKKGDEKSEGGDNG